jgi:hypothetical protein
LSAPSPHWRDCLDERQQLGDVVAVGAGEQAGELDAVGVGDQLMFAAGLAPIDRTRPGSPASKARAARRSTSPEREVEPSDLAEPGEQQFV